MTKLIIKTDEDISVLYLEYEKNICNYYGFKVCDEKIMPLPEDAIKILDIFKLSLNRKPLGTEDGYDVILDCDTNFKHYFKNNNEDFDKFILMNSEDLTVYEDDKINKKNISSIFFRRFILPTIKYAVIARVISIGVAPWIMLGSTYYEQNHYKIDIENTSYLSYDSKSVIIDYIMSSSNLNEKEKGVLINDDFLDFIALYLRESHFDIYLNDFLKDIDIVGYTDFTDPIHSNCDGYFHGDNKLHIKNYNEANPDEYKIVIGHEFAHLFQNPFCKPYIKEAMAAILNYEFYTNMEYSYPEEVANIKGLMEIIGPEPLIKYFFSGDFTEIENLTSVYLGKDDYNEFIRIISSEMFGKSDKKRNKDNKILKDLIYKMYANKYGEVDNDFRALINSDTNNVTRYYFNPKFINEENSYYIEEVSNPIDLKTAYDIGVVNCFYTEKVLYEDDSVKPELKYDEVIKQKYLYEYSEDIDSVVFEGNSGYFHHVTKGGMFMTIEEALNANYMKCIGYEITYSISYEESLNPEIKDDCQYSCITGYIEDNMFYDPELRVMHSVEPIDKKFPKEEQTKNF